MRLRITYRMLREGMSIFIFRVMAADIRKEVEGFIESAVGEALGEASSSANHDNLVDVLVRALENDAAWVELYGITGELIVPNAQCPYKHLHDAFVRATAVCHIASYFRDEVY